MPDQKTIHLVSGAQLLIRQRVAADYNIFGKLTDTSMDQEVTDAMARMLEACILQVVDRGVYSDSQFYPDGRLKCSGGLFVGDYWHYMLEHHELCRPGVPYQKRFICPDCPRDLSHQPFATDCAIVLGDEESESRLDDDGMYRLRVQRLDPEAAAQIKEKGTVTISVGGVSLEAKPITLAASMEIERLVVKNQDAKFTTIIAARIAAINSETDATAIDEWVCKRTDVELDDLADELDRVDCGVDMTIFPYCPACQQQKQWDIEIDPRFFVRSRKRRRRR